MSEENNGNTASVEPELFPLDEAAIEAIKDLDNQETQLVEASKNINVARNAILSYFLRQHKLQGNWQLAETRTELVRQATTATPAQAS
jgi:hypothetical protein